MTRCCETCRATRALRTVVMCTVGRDGDWLFRLPVLVVLCETCAAEAFAPGENPRAFAWAPPLHRPVSHGPRARRRGGVA